MELSTLPQTFDQIFDQTIDQTIEPMAVLTNDSSPILNNEKGSALPYLVAWMLGVPGSILLLIFMLRAIF